MQKESEQINIEQPVNTNVEQNTKSPVKTYEKQKDEEKQEEEHEYKVTSWSLTSKNIIDEDDTVSIQGPINMDMLCPIELMEIASAMQSKAHKKIMKAHRKEAQIFKVQYIYFPVYY